MYEISESDGLDRFLQYSIPCGESDVVPHVCTQRGEDRSLPITQDHTAVLGGVVGVALPPTGPSPPPRGGAGLHGKHRQIQGKMVADSEQRGESHL